MGAHCFPREGGRGGFKAHLHPSTIFFVSRLSSPPPPRASCLYKKTPTHRLWHRAFFFRNSRSQSAFLWEQPHLIGVVAYSFLSSSREDARVFNLSRETWLSNKKKTFFFGWRKPEQRFYELRTSSIVLKSWKKKKHACKSAILTRSWCSPSEKENNASEGEH